MLGTGLGSQPQPPAGVALIAAAPPEESRPPAMPLPPPAGVGPGLRQSAADAATTLGDLDAYARTTLPLALYERRLGEEEGRIKALDLGTENDSLAVRAAIDDILYYHRTARDIRRAKITFLSDRDRDVRASLHSMPYNSDSEVTRWIARYPFLIESLGASPVDHGVFGESSGHWNPDLATDLLWRKAREDTAKLAAWAAGAGSVAPPRGEEER